ncbi:MAG: GCN5-related N-acetyltransferase [Nocardioides sp.]|nr:GCN5-related N-acetyltransferase [Nocardioides sp.]
MPPTTDQRDLLEARWHAIVREELPAVARRDHWPLRLDHCFARVLLDAVCGGRWYDHVEGRPAYRHLDTERLARAVALGEELVAATDGRTRLEELNDQSLRWRGKRR